MGTFHELLLSDRAIDIAVDYYGEDDRACFGRYSLAGQIQRIAGGTISVPISEFLTYSMFTEKTAGIPRLQSYTAIRENLNRYIPLFDDGLRTTERSLRTVLTGNHQIFDLSEKIGSGIALSVTNRITGLTEADWNRIPVLPHKAFDYTFSSQAVGHLEVEAKGSSVTDNTGAKPDSVVGHAADIRGKFREPKLHAANYRVTRYGVIGAIDQRADGMLRSWLVDPPGGTLARNPRDQQIINRLCFVAEILEAVVPDSVLLVDLYRRILALSEAGDIEPFNGVPLSESLESWIEELLWTQPREADGAFFGTVVTLRNGTLFFYGLRREWIEAVQRQNFGVISELSFRPGTSTVEVAIPNRVVERLMEERRIAADRANRDLYVLARVQMASSGRVFGLVESWFSRRGVHVVRDE